MATTRNQPLNFITSVPLYDTNGTLSNSWRIFFQELWARTGGNTNQTITVNDLITNQSSSGDVSQSLSDLISRVHLLEANDAFSIAIQALQTVSGSSSGLSAGEVYAYSALGVT